MCGYDTRTVTARTGAVKTGVKQSVVVYAAWSLEKELRFLSHTARPYEETTEKGRGSTVGRMLAQHQNTLGLLNF